MKIEKEILKEKGNIAVLKAKVPQWSDGSVKEYTVIQKTTTSHISGNEFKLTKKDVYLDEKELSTLYNLLLELNVQ